MSEIITENLSYLIENAPSDEYQSILKELIDCYKVQTTKIQKTKQIDEDIKEKITTTFNFIKFIKTICKSDFVNPCIYGSLPRMMLERSFSGLYELDGYGNTINHDIDIYIYNQKDCFNKIEFQMIFNIINLTKANLSFGNYKIHSIHDKTIKISSRVSDNAKERLLDIPHYIVILQNGEKIIKYDILGYKIEPTHTWTNEFDINSLSIGNGIYSRDQYFPDILVNIMNKTAECTIDFKKISSPLSQSGLRSTKQKILNDILYFSCMRTKILSMGYTKIFNENFGSLVLSIEKYNDFIVTMNKPPYIQMELECGHTFSLMALAGITNIRASNDIESIVCPFCRHAIIPKLVRNQNPFKLQSYELNDSNVPYPEIRQYDIEEEIITKENKDYVNGLIFGLTPEQIITGNVPVSEYELLRRH